MSMRLLHRFLLRRPLLGVPDMAEHYDLDGQRVEVIRGKVWRVVFPTGIPDDETLLACRELDATPEQIEEWRRDVVDPDWRVRRLDEARRALGLPPIARR